MSAMLNTLEHFPNDKCVFIFFEVGQFSLRLARCRDGLLLSAQLELYSSIAFIH